MLKSHAVVDVEAELDELLNEEGVIAHLPAIPDEFQDRQRKYIYWRALGLTTIQASRRAGYADRNHGRKMETTNPKVREAIENLGKAAQIRFEIDRDKVVEGLMEAINVAREQSDARVMVQGWSEMARITGVEAPKKTEVTMTGEITHNTALNTVSDRELLKLVDKKREIGEFIDAEFTQVDDRDLQLTLEMEVDNDEDLELKFK